MALLDRTILFGAFRTILLARTKETYTPGEIAAIDAAFDETEAKAGLLPPSAPTTTAPAGAFILSRASLEELDPVKPELAACAKLAITKTAVDFRVNQGLRTLAEQKAAVAAGNSRTMKSKHLRQADGFVWAVDLVALIDGKVTWDFATYAGIAYAMDHAATELGVAQHVRWGCAWDRVLSDFGGSPPAYLAEAKAYAARHAGSDLLDAPHFEWVP
jgi:peptidoglycan L-alanyl-D-glutamate endopeptidase CwlK